MVAHHSVINTCVTLTAVFDSYILRKPCQKSNLATKEYLQRFVSNGFLHYTIVLHAHTRDYMAYMLEYL